MEHTWIKFVRSLLTRLQFRSLLKATGDMIVVADNQVLDPPAPATNKARKDSAYLAKLEKLAAAGGHGVDLGAMSDDEIRARLLGR